MSFGPSLHTALAEIDALRAEIQAAEAEYAKLAKADCRLVADLEDQNAALRAEVERLKAALVSFADHAPACDLEKWVDGYFKPGTAQPPCNCGLDAALGPAPGGEKTDVSSDDGVERVSTSRTTGAVAMRRIP